MDQDWLRCFWDIGGDPAQPCRFVGARLQGEMFQGHLLAAPHGARVNGGVVDFTPGPDRWGDLPGWDQMRINWQNANGCRDAPLTREIAETDGPILDVATGPGGGWMPAVRQVNPEARVMVNDISPGVLALWRSFLAAHDRTAGMCFAAFDGTRPVIRSESLAAVTSFGGFGNIGAPLGDPADDAVVCMHDALRSGGLLYAKEMLFDSADWAHLDAAARARWEAEPVARHLLLPISTRLERAGFDIVDREVSPGRALDRDEGGLPRVAATYGITLHIQWEQTKARKP